MAVLAGDGLIVMAFEVLARRAGGSSRLGALVASLAEAAGAARGLVSGQAWESEPSVGLRRYHRAKTASLFGASARVGAIAAGVDPDPWTAFGLRLGEAYQVFDDLRDTGDACELMDKPMGQDEALGRPNAALALGPARALERLQELLTGATQILPDCPRPRVIEQWIASFSSRLLPALTAAASEPAASSGEFQPAVRVAGLQAGG
jgi:geranylgeranyl diphosphate synthase type II